MIAAANPRSVSQRASSRRLAASQPPDVAIYTFSSRLGWMAVAAEGDLICGLVFGHHNEPAAIRSLGRNLATMPGVTQRLSMAPAEIRAVAQRLQAYATGEQVDFLDVQLDTAHLTPFGKLVTQRCREIEWGETLSYRELAAECDRPGAARAVGNVMRNNRYPLMVPCHRVLASGGGLGGYSAPQGLAMKRRLLELESAHYAAPSVRD